MNKAMKMKTLATAIQKGGQGKTAVTCNLAFDFEERGLRVCVIDLDTQGNASYTLKSYEGDIFASELFDESSVALTSRLKDELNSHSEDKGIYLFRADPNLANLDKLDFMAVAKKLKGNIAAISDLFDVCLIDTAPSLGVAMTAAIMSADYVVSPIELEAYSIQGMQMMVNLIGNVRKQNPKLGFIGMVPNKVDARKPRHISNLALLTKTYPKLIVPTTVGHRDSIAEALGERRPVWKMKKTAARKASKEVRALAQYIFNAMELAR